MLTRIRCAVFVFLCLSSVGSARGDFVLLEIGAQSNFYGHGPAPWDASFEIGGSLLPEPRTSNPISTVGEDRWLRDANGGWTQWGPYYETRTGLDFVLGGIPLGREILSAKIFLTDISFYGSGNVFATVTRGTLPPNNDVYDPSYLLSPSAGPQYNLTDGGLISEVDATEFVRGIYAENNPHSTIQLHLHGSFEYSIFSAPNGTEMGSAAFDYSAIARLEVQLAAVPESSTMALVGLAAGAFTIGLLRRRSSRQAGTSPANRQ